MNTADTQPCFVFPDGSVVKNLPAGDAGLIPGSGRFPAGGNGNLPPVLEEWQHSSILAWEIPMDRRA